MTKYTPSFNENPTKCVFCGHMLSRHWKRYYYKTFCLDGGREEICNCPINIIIRDAVITGVEL